MRIIQEFQKEELEQVLNEFYAYFSTGFDFEEFLKPFLEAIGLSEVVVTKKTGDGGIDLTAVKDGLSEINNVDSVKYRVQAKKFNPKSTISPEKIDALRGNLGYNEKGLFITTAKVSERAKENAITKDPYKPVFVIDGVSLVRICIEKQIGFAYKPVFSKSALDEFMRSNEFNEAVKDPSNITTPTELEYVDKVITANDIRCNILSLPRIIFDKIDENKTSKKIKTVINNKKYELSLSPERRYLYLAKEYNILSEFKLKNDDGTIQEHNAKWAIDNNQTIYITIL